MHRIVIIKLFEQGEKKIQNEPSATKNMHLLQQTTSSINSKQKIYKKHETEQNHVENGYNNNNKNKTKNMFSKLKNLA